MSGAFFIVIFDCLVLNLSYFVLLKIAVIISYTMKLPLVLELLARLRNVMY